MGGALGSALARLSPPASLTVSLLFSYFYAYFSPPSIHPVHPNPPMSVKRLVQKCSIRSQGSLRLRRTSCVSRRCGCSGWLLFVALGAVPLHVGPSALEATFLLPGWSLLYFLQHPLQQHRLLCDCLRHRLQADFQCQGWWGSSVCFTGMARGACSVPLTARYSSIACTAALMVGGATANRWR